MNAYRSSPSPRRQRGFTMIELMIALLIGLFLMGGLMTLVQDNKRTFNSQSQLAQLQDGERLALSMMTDVIQQTGYYPDPTTNTAMSTLAAATLASETWVGNAFAVGQALTGTDSATAPGDTVTARYTSTSGDGILNCTGASNGTGGNVTYVNTFSVANSQLICTRETGTPYPLVDGVTNMQILYGVNTTGGGNNADTYMTAVQVTNWNNVISVQVTLSFINPLCVTAIRISCVTAGLATYQGQPATLPIQRTISILNQTG